MALRNPDDKGEDSPSDGIVGAIRGAIGGFLVGGMGTGTGFFVGGIGGVIVGVISLIRAVIGLFRVNGAYSKQSKSCINCGREVSSSDRFCSECGTNIGEQEVERVACLVCGVRMAGPSMLELHMERVHPDMD